MPNVGKFCSPRSHFFRFFVHNTGFTYLAAVFEMPDLKKKKQVRHY